MNLDKKIVLLSTKSLHHDIFIKNLILKNIFFDNIFYETSYVKPKFKTHSWIEEKQKNYELSKLKELKHIELNDCKNFSNFNSDTFLNILKTDKADLGIVFGTRVLNQDVINSFKDGLINVHRGIIDKYRGLDSDLWAYYHKDFKNIGTTIHYINTGIDKGDIIEIKHLNKNKINIETLRYETSMIAARIISTIITKYKKKLKITRYKQKKLGKYYSFMPKVIKDTLKNV